MGCWLSSSFLVVVGGLFRGANDSAEGDKDRFFVSGDAGLDLVLFCMVDLGVPYSCVLRRDSPTRSDTSLGSMKMVKSPCPGKFNSTVLSIVGLRCFLREECRRGSILCGVDCMQRKADPRSGVSGNQWLLNLLVSFSFKSSVIAFIADACSSFSLNRIIFSIQSQTASIS